MSGASDGAGGQAARRTPGGPRCPICKEPTAREYRPFCSRRCADIDLGRWMNGAYAAPAAEEDDPDAAPDGAAHGGRPCD